MADFDLGFRIFDRFRLKKGFQNMAAISARNLRKSVFWTMGLKAIGIALMGGIALSVVPQEVQAASRNSRGKTVTVGGNGRSAKRVHLNKKNKAKQSDIVEQIKEARTRGALNVLVRRAISQRLVTPKFIHAMHRCVGGGNERQRLNCIYTISMTAEPRYANSLLPRLMRELGDAEETEVRVLCAKSIGRLGTQAGARGIDALGRALEDKTSAVRREASTALAKVNGKKHSATILKLAKDGSEYLEARQAHILALGQLKYAPAVPTLEGLLKSDQEILRLTAARALCSMNEDAGRRFAERQMKSPDEYQRKDSVWILGNVKFVWAMDNLATLLNDKAVGVQIEAAKALALAKDNRGVSWLVLTSKAMEAQGNYEMVNRLEQAIEDAKISSAQRKSVLAAQERNYRR